MNQPTIAVIIPTLNRPKLLEKCLISVARQTIPPTECIVVDQSDNQETQQLFERLDLGKIKKIYVHQKKKSLIYARNNGLDHVGSTEFTCFLDDDIVLAPNYFELLLVHLKDTSGKNYAGGMGTISGTNPKSQFFEKFFQLPHYGSGKFLASGAPTFPHALKKFGEVEFLSGGMTLYRTPIIKEYRYDERLIGYGHGDDVDVNYRISRKHKLFFEPAAVIYQSDEVPNRDPGTIHRKQFVQNMYYLLQKNVGLNWKTSLSFGWMLAGLSLDDLRKFKRSALIGDLIGIYNVLRDNLDSVENYKDFKKNG